MGWKAPALCMWLAAAAIGGCGESREEKPTPPSSRTAAPGERTNAGPSASAAPPVDEPLGKDAKPEERRDVCSRLVTIAREACGDGVEVDRPMVAMCEQHPVWRCPELTVNEVENCWVPLLDRDRKPIACPSFMDKLARCAIPTTIRNACPGYLEKVVEGSVAARAGLRTGDRVLAVAGKPFSVLDSLASVVTASEGKPLVVRVQRQGEDPVDVPVTPAKDAQGIYRIGVIPGNPPECRFLPNDSLLFACRRRGR